MILGAGLGFLMGEDFSGEETDLPKNTQQLVTRLVEDEAILASTRFRMFELQQANRNWELSNGAVYKENISLKNLASRHIEEIKGLKEKIKDLENELGGLRSQLEVNTNKEGKESVIERHSAWKNWIRKILK
ncbi:MAG: hypothetical protein HPY59_15205 [Anaerolineae bacterium]|nr:hypothetical protein [Anaerolineae bacterium]